MLGLRFCARAFSSCGKRGPPFIALRRPLTIAASLVAENRLQTRRLSNCGLWAQLLGRHVRSSQNRARTRVPCTGRQILNHCATREALSFFYFILFFGCVGSLLPCVGFSLVAASGGYSVVRGLLIAVASLVAEHEP